MLVLLLTELLLSARGFMVENAPVRVPVADAAVGLLFSLLSYLRTRRLESLFEKNESLVTHEEDEGVEYTRRRNGSRDFS